MSLKYLAVFFLLFFKQAFAVELQFSSGAVYNVKIAREIEELQTGLMNVSFLPNDEGMLFDLRRYQDKPSFMWMKNTLIKLDMLFIDCQFRVVDIYENAEPLSLKKISSRYPFCYVLEINGGQVATKQLKIGDSIVLKDES